MNFAAIFQKENIDFLKLMLYDMQVILTKTLKVRNKCLQIRYIDQVINLFAINSFLFCIQIDLLSSA